MTNELFTSDGKRKYLNAAELETFVKSAANQDRAEVRTFCLVMAHTGCRISEALALTPTRIDLTEQAITFRTLKQRDKRATAEFGNYYTLSSREALTDLLGYQPGYVDGWT